MAIGPVAGVAPGAIFADRTALHRDGVHRDIRRGICGSGIRGAGAESVLLTGGYEDDEDHGDLIVYTGQGGRDPETGRQSADQQFTGLNQSLATNVESGNPVRVIDRTDSGYRYRGMYSVASAKQARGKSGFLICRYELLPV